MSNNCEAAMEQDDEVADNVCCREYTNLIGLVAVRCVQWHMRCARVCGHYAMQLIPFRLKMPFL